MTKRVIMLEFNELSPSLMDRFIGEGHLPGFEALRAQSTVCVTDAEEDPPALEPWIQWVTVHTGLRYAEHGVFDLGDGPKLAANRLWDVISEEGGTVWVCGSMNAAIQAADLKGLVLPDPWAVGLAPYPEDKLKPYFRLVQTYVQEYARETVPLGGSDYLNFAWFMLRNGLSLETVSQVAGQLLSERFGKPRANRAVLLDRLQWDLFRHHYRRLRPDLATFFLNSTAHYQHYYWRAQDPDGFALKPSDEEVRDYSNTILLGYQKMDALVRECFEIADEDTTIVLCTALSQQPMHKYDSTGGKQVFKPADVAGLVSFAGITAHYRYAPVMAEQFHLIFDSEADARTAEHALNALTLEDGSLLMSARSEGIQVFAGCIVNNEPMSSVRIASPRSNKRPRFGEAFIAVGGVKSGMHHRDGILWIRTPDRLHKIIDRKVSLTEIAPTVMALSGRNASTHFKSAPMPELALN